MAKKQETTACRDDCGTLPSCAPLSVPFVPFQETNAKRYAKMDALKEGTLFPGLNLPFHIMKNGQEVASCPRSELQALSFVVHELGLYLDTHPADMEAYSLFQNYAALLEQGQKSFREKIGPLTQLDAAQGEQYTWVNGPWPWQNADTEG